MQAMKLLLLAIVLAAACLGLVQGRDCEEDDYKTSYTACTSSGTRDLVYYLRSNVNCTGGYPAPTNIYNLPCGISCPAGMHLPLGSTTCEACPAGQFSIGGGETFFSWYELDKQFTSYGHNTTGANTNMKVTSLGWTIGGTYIRSGNITDNQASVLSLSVYIESLEGHVSFSYRVNAEGAQSLNWDGLSFQVDGVDRLKKVSHTSNYVTQSYPLSVGAHVLTWIYSKDATISKGEDAAFINLIEVGGKSFADDFCEGCPMGTYAPSVNSTKCLPCPANSFNDQMAATQCSPCAGDEYSFSESVQCYKREACTEASYESFFTPCDSTGKRTLTYEYITPVICDTDHHDLPPTATGLDCGSCTDGAYRDNTTHSCTYCPDGQFSTGGQPCAACPAGTAAVKNFAVTQFNDWVVGSSTNCSGDCYNQGWELHSTSMNSGVGHGSNVNSWFQFPINLTAAGVVEFKFQITCPSTQCSLSFDTGSGEPIVYVPTQRNETASIPLAAGAYTLKWTFSKYDYSTGYNDTVTIFNITITSASIGGASVCSHCPNGTISAQGSSLCSPCEAGKQSDEFGRTCEVCPAGTHNPVAGGMCIPCGFGTSSLPDRTGCDVNCTFSPDGVTRFDLTKLKSATSYGPIRDSTNQDYFINVCEQQPQNCYSGINKTITTYACQETAGKIPGSQIPLGKDIGHVLGWQPLPPNNTYKAPAGVIMTFDYGDLGCPTNGVAKHRNAKIGFVCDPMAGIGSPQPEGTLVEHTGCSYSFVWRSLYACPVCNEQVDMDFYYSSCQNGQRTKTYYWRVSPPLCHSGELPVTSIVNCTESSTVCAAGQYLEEGKCVSCKAGSFSVGGGERITSWDVMPSRFSSQCTPSGECSAWRGGEDGLGTVSSGTGNSSLTASYNFVVAGSISFFYKLYSPSVGMFTFSLDTQEQLHLTKGTNRLGWVSVTIPVAKGVHVFEWAFTSGSEATTTMSRVGAVLKDLTVVGTDYHDDSCTPCSPGFKSAANSSSCTACSIDHYSQADSASCLACPTNTTSLAKASTCVERTPCTDADVLPVYSECIGSSRNLSFVFLQPQHCFGTLPAPQVVECDTECAPGTYSDPEIPGGECLVCDAGKYWDGSNCVPANGGYAALKQKHYFVDSKSAGLPTSFTTSCSGDCGSAGWRAKNGTIDSGYHGSNAVDSLLKLQTTVLGGFAGISFSYSVVSDSESTLSLYIDGTFIAALFGNSQYTVPLTEGQHTITWDYHQHQHSTGYAELSNIVVSGSTDADAGSVLKICPAGSYSANASSSCSLCPPGSFSATEGLTQCKLCPIMTYSSIYGATECPKCKDGSYSSEEGADFCETECEFTGSIGDKAVTFSLHGSGMVGPLVAFNSEFYFNICNSTVLSAPCNISTPTHACSVEKSNNGVNKSRDWGGYLEYVSYPTPVVSGSANTTYSLTFSNGDSEGCPEGLQRSVTFLFKCDKWSTGVHAVYNHDLSSSCSAVFDWAGNVGCPVCQDSDYDTLVGPCVGGMKTAQKIRRTDCNGEAVLTQASQSCSGTVEFSIVVVFVVIGIILVLVAVAVIVFIKNRRITAQYSRLRLNQGDGATHTIDNEAL